MFKEIKHIIEKNESRKGRVFDIFIQLLIIVSLATYSIETLPNLSSQNKSYLQTVELIIVIIFTIEYILRVIVSDKPVKFFLSLYGLIDLFAILPFYLSFGIDLRGIRAIRLLRLFRAFKLLRYNKALQRFNIALRLSKEEFVLFSFISLIMLYLSAAGIHYFENKAQPENFSSIFDSLWWAICTLTTVGYGDVYPITIGGRIFTFFILIIGLSIVSVPAGIISSALSKAREMQNQENEPRP